MRGVIFRKAQNKIQNPANLRRLVADLIDRESWLTLDADVKGDAYEGLLQKNAEDVKGGAGQYLTPRPLIQAIVDCVRPGPKDTICDPACGTGGFLLAAYEFVSHHHRLDKEQKRRLKHDALRGWEIVDATARLCVMNLYLHGIDPDEGPVRVADSLASDSGARFSLVLTNPPFGKQSTMAVINEEGEAEKQDQVVDAGCAAEPAPKGRGNVATGEGGAAAETRRPRHGTAPAPQGRRRRAAGGCHAPHVAGKPALLTCGVALECRSTPRRRVGPELRNRTRDQAAASHAARACRSPPTSAPGRSGTHRGKSRR